MSKTTSQHIQLKGTVDAGAAQAWVSLGGFYVREDRAITYDLHFLVQRPDFTAGSTSYTACTMSGRTHMVASNFNATVVLQQRGGDDTGDIHLIVAASPNGLGQVETDAARAGGLEFWIGDQGSGLVEVFARRIGTIATAAAVLRACVTVTPSVEDAQAAGMDETMPMVVVQLDEALAPIILETAAALTDNDTWTDLVRRVDGASALIPVAPGETKHISVTMVFRHTTTIPQTFGRSLVFVGVVSNVAGTVTLDEDPGDVGASVWKGKLVVVAGSGVKVQAKIETVVETNYTSTCRASVMVT